VATLVRPVRELCGFQAVELQPGESASVSFTLTRADLAYAGPDGRPLTEPGLFDLFIAPSASAGAAVTLRLLAA
jgi:beta-glucosidase